MSMKRKKKYAIYTQDRKKKSESEDESILNDRPKQAIDCAISSE